MAATAKKKPKPKSKKAPRSSSKATVKKVMKPVTTSIKSRPQLTASKAKPIKKQVVKRNAAKVAKPKIKRGKTPTTAKTSSVNKKTAPAVSQKTSKPASSVKTKKSAKSVVAQPTRVQTKTTTKSRVKSKSNTRPSLKPVQHSRKVTKPHSAKAMAIVKRPTQKSVKPKQVGSSNDIFQGVRPSKQQGVPAKSSVMKVKRAPVSMPLVATELFEEDRTRLDDDVPEDLSPDVDAVTDELSDAFGEDEDFSDMADDLDDDLTEDLSEELGTEKYFRDTNVGLDDDESILRGW